MPDRIVRAAVAIADAEGYQAVSMRRIGAALEVPTMSLYRFVPGREELNLRMIDLAMDAGDWPDPPPRGWRPRLEYVARRQRAASRAHPWLGRVISFTRPQLAPNAMDHTEWTMAALRAEGLDTETQLFIAVLLASYVAGSAVNLESETEAQRDTGLDSDEWMQTQEHRFAAILASGRFPMMSTILEVPEFDLNLDRLFEFGLAILLDGIAALIQRSSQRCPG
jgi:AcrR family transcriptional regulator